MWAHSRKSNLQAIAILPLIILAEDSATPATIEQIVRVEMSSLEPTDKL